MKLNILEKKKIFLLFTDLQKTILIKNSIIIHLHNYHKLTNKTYFIFTYNCF